MSRLSEVKGLKKVDMTPEIRENLEKAFDDSRKFVKKLAKKREEERQRLLDIKDEF